MELDISLLVEALKRKDVKKAKEWLDAKKSEADPNDEFLKGYFLAWEGMISALESNQELSLIQKLLSGNPDEAQLEKLSHEVKKQLSLKFRPKDEQGFSKAWLDFLKSLSD